MRKHTPGPWKAVVLAKEDPDWLYEIVSDRKDDPEGDLICTGGLGKANATLIAAAPDLFKALQSITDELEQQYDFANGEDSIFEKTRIRLIKQSRAALAKAEGK